jgi:hypothetical protein
MKLKIVENIFWACIPQKQTVFEAQMTITMPKKHQRRTKMQLYFDFVLNFVLIRNEGKSFRIKILGSLAPQESYS